jgi:DnaK suppressor protein
MSLFFGFGSGERAVEEGIVAKINKKGIAPKPLKSAARTKDKPVGKVVQAKIVVAKPQLKVTGKPPAIPMKEKPRRPIPVRVPEEEEVIIPTAAAVPTNGRPRKNLAGIAPKELEVFRDRILAKRREIVGDMSSMEREALRSGSGSNLSNLPLHMADMGTDNYEQEFTLGLMEKDRKLLRDLNDALAKIQNGTYGICEGTGKPITKARLEAQPWARYSIEYARKLERRLG